MLAPFYAPGRLVWPRIRADQVLHTWEQYQDFPYCFTARAIEVLQKLGSGMYRSDVGGYSLRGKSSLGAGDLPGPPAMRTQLTCSDHAPRYPGRSLNTYRALHVTMYALDVQTIGCDEIFKPVHCGACSGDVGTQRSGPLESGHPRARCRCRPTCARTCC